MNVLHFSALSSTGPLASTILYSIMSTLAQEFDNDAEKIISLVPVHHDEDSIERGQWIT